jgi:acyl carrier protein
MSSISVALRSYIEKRFLTDRPVHFSNDDSLITLRVVDVFGLLDLIAFIESQYFINFDDGELLPHNLDTINKLTAAIEKRLMVSPLET